MANALKPDKTTRVDFNTYAMLICNTVAMRSTCRHRDCGAIIVKDRKIISTGYNGAPSGIKDCLERGYCSKIENIPCLAQGLHAESNAIISAARNGVSTLGATMYTKYSPCRTCCNIIKGAGITDVYYEELYSSDPCAPEYLAELEIRSTELKVVTNKCVTK